MRVTYICTVTHKVRQAKVVRTHTDGSVDLWVYKPLDIGYRVFNVKEGSKPGTFQKK